MQAIDDGDLRPEQVASIARALDVREDDVISMNRRMAAPDHSLNATIHHDREGEWQDWLADDSESQGITYAEREEQSGRQAILTDAMNMLRERELHIIAERRLKDNPATLKATIEELAGRYGISRERVRQIEVRAFEKLQKAMKARIAARGRHVSNPTTSYPDTRSAPSSTSLTVVGWNWR